MIDSLDTDKSNDVLLRQFNPITQARLPMDTAEVSLEGKYDLSYELSGPELFQVHFPGRQSVTLIVDEGQRDIVLNVEGKRNGKVELSGSPDATYHYVSRSTFAALSKYATSSSISYCSATTMPPLSALGYATTIGNRLVL